MLKSCLAQAPRNPKGMISQQPDKTKVAVIKSRELNIRIAWLLVHEWNRIKYIGTH